MGGGTRPGDPARSCQLRCMKSLQNTMHHLPGCDPQVGRQGPPPPPKPQPPSPPPRCLRWPHPARPTILPPAGRTGRQGHHLQSAFRRIRLPAGRTDRQGHRLHSILHQIPRPSNSQSFVHQIGPGEIPPGPAVRLVRREVQVSPPGGLSPRTRAPVSRPCASKFESQIERARLTPS